MRISIKWNPYVELWFMAGPHGREMYRFCDCVNFNALYRNLDKSKTNYYEQDVLYPIDDEYDAHDNGITKLLKEVNTMAAKKAKKGKKKANCK